MLSNHVYYFPILVLGSELNALVYSYLYDVPLLKSGNTFPFVTDFFDVKMSLAENFNFPYQENKLLTKKGIRIFGWQKQFLYKRLSFALSLSGLNFLSGKFASLRIDEEKKNIIVYIGRERLVRISYDRLIVFDDKRLEFPDLLVKPGGEKKHVLDWINVRSAEPHEIDFIQTKYDIANQIYFYESIRKDLGKKYIEKDMIVGSVISAEDIEEFECSETYVTLITKRLLYKSGIKGAKNGFGYNKKKKPRQKYKSIFLEHEKRQIRDVDRNKYKDTDSLFFKVGISEEEIIREFEERNLPLESYTKKLIFSLFPKEEKWTTNQFL